MPEILKGREVLFEYITIGNIVRVTAMDTATLTEIIISCPKGPEERLQTMALKRLEYVMKKKGLIS